MNSFQRFKKIIFIVLFFALVALIGYFIWSLFFTSQEEPVIIDENGQIVSGLPDAATGTPIISTPGSQEILPFDPFRPDLSELNRPSPIAGGSITATELMVNDKTLSPTVSSDGSIQYYNENDGKFYKINANGDLELLSDRVFYNVDDVVWAPSKDKAVLEYPDGRKILYNFETGKQVSLQSHWEDFSFSPDSSKLVSKSLALDPQNRWLVVSNDDGSKATAIERIGTNANLVYNTWSPNNQVIALYTEGVDFNRQEVFFIGQNGENFKSTIIEGRGFDPLWSTDGDRLLYSVYNTADGMNPRLWVVGGSPDKIGQTRTSLDLMTWANKCTFATNNDLYCAVPESLPEGAGLFPELADSSKDLLYKIDLKNSTKQIIAIPDGAFNVSDLMVPENQENLYFTDKTSGSLYKIDLK